MKSVLSPTFKKTPLLQRPARQVSRLHRWLGTGFALLFALWFGTGFVMIYVPFPSLSDAARISSLAPIQMTSVHVAPSKAVQGLSVQRLRLIDVLGRPRYLATLDDGGERSIAADDGSATPPLGADDARRLAEQFSQHRARSVSGPFDYDQWVVHQRFDAARPFYRVDLGDAAGTELYVSARLGEVLQRTTSFERGWNWVGAVVHWIYPTVLRQSLWAWDQVVWWVALAGIIVAVTGFGLGLVRMLNSKRSGRTDLSPFRGLLRWHHLLGLTGGLFAVTWVFSGWLSMDHGRLFSVDRADAGRVSRFQVVSIGSAMTGLTPETLRTLGTAREIEFLAVGGHAFVVHRCGGAGAYRLTPVRAGVPLSPIAQLPDALLADAVAIAWAPTRVFDIMPIAKEDSYAHTRSDPLPDTARRVRLGDDASTWVHVDAQSGQIISLMDRSRRVYRWLFTGLHTFDFPFLNRAGSLWQVLMLFALVAGLGLSVSALVLGGKRIAKSLNSR